jgi:hypothetical protein
VTGFYDAADLCEDCGIPLDRHGEDCGYYADEEYGNPEYGRPAGWLNAGTGQFTPVGPDYDPPGPGVRCRSCGALPDEQHREECPERDPGPVWPGGVSMSQADNGSEAEDRRGR